MEELHKNLKVLGEGSTAYGFDKPDPGVLEKFPSPFSLEEMNACAAEGSINIMTSEFSSLCPLTGQPDWATIRIDYTPDQFCVESKSLKLYLGGFRNHGEFHESCICRICNDLVKLLAPKALTVVGEFTARGGVPFWPTASYTKPIAASSDIVDEGTPSC